MNSCLRRNTPFRIYVGASMYFDDKEMVDFKRGYLFEHSRISQILTHAHLSVILARNHGSFKDT
jgi:hypothetical protein